MSGQHTQGKIEAFTEPEFSGWWALREKTDDGINHELGSGDGGLFEPDARRLAACWNACDGSETEDLERLGADFIAPWIKMLDERDNAVKELAAARALLQEVISNTIAHKSFLDADEGYDVDDWTDRVRSFLEGK